MEKQILEEINRYREIVGLKLITEGIGDEFAEMVSALIKNTDSITDDAVEAIARQIKKVAEADALAKKIDLDKYLDDMLITGKVSDDIANLINKAILTNKGYTDVVRKLVKDTDPVLINIKNAILDNDAIDLIKMADSLDELKRLENDFLNDFKNHTDPFGNSLSDEMIALYKKDIDDATSSRRVELETPGKIASETVETSQKQALKDAKDLIDKIKDELSDEGKKLSRNLTVEEVLLKLEKMSEPDLITFYKKLGTNTKWSGFKNWLSKSVNPRIKNFLKTIKLLKLDDAGELVFRPGMTLLYATTIGGIYILFDMYRTSESEWKELYDNLLTLCPNEKLKDNQTASIAPDIKENNVLRTDWVISVVYDSKKTSVFYEDGNWFLDVKSGKPGEEYLPLNCNDAKLANKTFGEIGGTSENEEETKKEELNNATKTLDDFKKSEKGVGYESTATEVSTGKFKRSPTSAMTYTWDATGNKFVGAVD
jgi:hypothetical protein